MLENFEMPREGRPGGQSRTVTQTRRAARQTIPSSDGAGGQICDAPHAVIAPGKLPAARLDRVVRDTIRPATGGDDGHSIRVTLAWSAAIHPSGFGRDDEAASATISNDQTPRRRKPRASGTGEASEVAEPTRLSPPPKNARRKPGADRARKEMEPFSPQLDPQPYAGNGGGDLGHFSYGNQYGHAEVAELIKQVKALWKRRQRWHKAEKSLTLQCFSLCWSHIGGGVENKKLAGKLLKRIEDGGASAEDLFAEISCAPLLAARGMIRKEREGVERTLSKMARGLPAYPWVKGVYGAGDLSFAAIVGEAGDLGSYKSRSALWKRMGLAVIDGERQQKKSGDAAKEHGYSPARRSVMWNIGGVLVGGMGHGPRPAVGEDVTLRDDLSPYQKLFVERLRYEAERDPESHRKDPVASAKTGELRESFSSHAANRARRYVEKRFLRDLYGEWRRATGQAGEERLSS